MSQTLYDFSAQCLNGDQQSLDAYRGSVLLIVNTASQCGFTPQYAGLEELYRRFKDRVLLFSAFRVTSSVRRNRAMPKPSASFARPVSM